MPYYPTYASRLNRPLTVAVTTDTIATITDLMIGTHAAAANPCVVPVNDLGPGKSVYSRFAGTFSTTGTPTLIFGLYYGTTALAISSTITTASGAATLPWIWESVTDVRSDAPNTACVTWTQGTLRYGLTATTMTELWVPASAPAAVNVDNSAAGPWTVKATWGTSSASNIVVLHQVTVLEISP